ncbi:hypothetical protein CPB86DRAFT_755916 [Serendipita vermifera]|nr:hypothetical protein CPB86DRAFT_755916 [Serendipita vermifera]
MKSIGPEKLRILSLDGGETRCLSQLRILGEFMHRLHVDTGIERRPCDYFQLIVGTGAGGVVAVLLTIFGLDVEETIEAFIRICNAVFPKEGCTPSARATKLESVTKDLLQERKLPLDLKLLDERNSVQGPCKVAICYMSTSHLGQCRLLRSYPVRNTLINYKPTVVETLRTAWATPNLFPPVRIGPLYREEEIVSAVHGYNNPTLEVLKEALDVFGSNAYLSCLLSLGAGKGIIKSFGAGASGAGGAAGAPREDSLETGKNESNNPMSILEQLTTDGESIAEEAFRRIGNLGIYFRFSVSRGLDFDDVAAQRDGVSTKFGEIIAHTTGYLLENTTSSYLDKAIASAERPSTISLEAINRSRSRGLRASHGLPPLSSFFIMREQPMKFLVDALLESEGHSQRIVVLSGLGGSGKTQMALKFARDYEHRYQHIFFVDASTTENIETALVTHVSSLGREYECSSVSDALDILAEPDQVISQDWLIIFDNADDPNIDLRDYFPMCEHGSILITTRNLMLGDLSSRRHLELDVMSPEEAVETLLITAFTQGETPTEEDKKEASVIVEQLGYLPVAITQAGCYIRQQKCLHDYANRLKANRRKLLERPTRTHRDKLRYRHSVYAAFDVTLEVLSSRARDFLRILSTVHFTNFPLPLIGAAAKGGFAFEINDLLDRPPEHQETISLLKETLCPDGEWDDDQITDLLEELQQYSLVVVVASTNIATLRFHPLVHSWAYDRLTEKEEKMYQAAAVRLIACGTDWIHVSLFDYLSSHIYSLSSIWGKLHVNDRAAFARIIRYDGKADMLFELTKGICEEVEKVAGKDSIRATNARLDLADAYGMIDDDKTMEEMEREVVATREAILGRDDLVTIEAVSNLASTIEDDDNRLEEALALREEVLKVRKEKLGMENQDTADAMAYLGQTYHRLKRYSDEEPLLISAREIRAKGLGPAHPWTIDVMVSLANCYTDQDDYDKAEAIQNEVLQLETKQLGVKHVETVKTMEWMCRAYYNQRKYAEAEKLGEQALILRKEISGPEDDDTLSWMDWLARVYHDTGRFVDAKRLREEEIERRKEVVGERHTSVYDAMSWLVSALHSLGEYQKHEELAKQLLAGRAALLGEKHVETLNAKSWLARSYHDLKRHKEAGELRKEEWEARCEVQGEQHIDTINALGWLARAYHEQGRHEEAASLREKELEQRKAVQGERNIDAVNTLSWLARAYQELKRVNDAEKLRSEEVEYRKKEQGPNHEETLNAMSWLGQAYQEQGRHVDAENLRKEEIAGRTKILGARHHTTLNALSWLVRSYSEQTRYPEMVTAAEELLEGRKEIYDDEHPDVFAAIQWLGRAYFYDKKYEKARPLWEDIVRRRSSSLGDRHLDTLNATTWLSRIHHEVGEHHEALELRMQEFPLRIEVQGPLHADTLNALEWIVQENEDLKEYEEAKTRAEELQAKRMEAFGPDDLSTVNAQAWMANILHDLGQYNRSIEIRRNVLNSRTRIVGPRTSLVALTKQKLARTLHAMGEQEEALSLATEAVEIQQEVAESNDSTLKDMMELVRTITSAAPPQGISVSATISQPEDVGPSIEGAACQAERLEDKDGPVPDPEENNSDIGESEQLHIPRAPSPMPSFSTPFTQREAFGRRPNQWSMFF